MSKKNYSIIFKSTFLFGFVQFFNILAKVILNKVAAVTMGSQGIGLIGLYNSAIGMLKTGTSLGIPITAVRDVSESNQKNDIELLSKTIVTTNKTIIITASLGLFVTIVLSDFLSQLTFGNSSHIGSFMIISLAVALTTLWEGQLAILKGMRRLILLAKANIFGASVGLFISVPLYLMYEMKGIIPVLITTPFCSLLLSTYYVQKIKYKRIKLSYKELYQNASSMVKMGIVLSFTTFLSQLSTFAIIAYIGKVGSLETLGFYNAGIIIIVGYFSVIINALTTDYFPRISAVSRDNSKLQMELNQQSIVSLLLTFPLMVLFLFLLPFLITLLYSSEFYPVIDFVRIGVYGTFITIISNQIDLILVAKNETKVFAVIAIIYRSIEIFITIFLFKAYGLLGLGVSIVLTGIVHMAIMSIVVKKLYKIQFDKLFIKTAILILFCILLTSSISLVDNLIIRYSSGSVIFILSCFFSIHFSKKYLDFNILNILSKN
jgi:O-antigen/teichoic acid export membrane protein